MSIFIHQLRVYEDEFAEIHELRQTFVVFPYPQFDVRPRHVVNVIELESATGDRTGRELRADIIAVRDVGSALVAGIVARETQIRS